jgi:hypothetical protein
LQRRILLLLVTLPRGVPLIHTKKISSTGIFYFDANNLVALLSDSFPVACTASGGIPSCQMFRKK